MNDIWQRCRRSDSVYSGGVSLQDRSGRIDRGALRLLWEQVADDLRAEIRAGTLPGGARLPSEPELASQYGVSRDTIRRAVQDLVSGGFLVVLRGHGTYVKMNR